MSAYGDLAATKPTGLSTLVRQMEAEHADEAAQAHVEGRRFSRGTAALLNELYRDEFTAEEIRVRVYRGSVLTHPTGPGLRLP